MPYWDHMYGWGGWIGGIFMMLMMFVFWGAIIYLAYYLIRRASQQPSGASPYDTPLEIARRRYAKGEISKEEFEQIKRDLQS